MSSVEVSKDSQPKDADVLPSTTSVPTASTSASVSQMKPLTHLPVSLNFDIDRDPIESSARQKRGIKSGGVNTTRRPQHHTNGAYAADSDEADNGDSDSDAFHDNYDDEEDNDDDDDGISYRGGFGGEMRRRFGNSPGVPASSAGDLRMRSIFGGGAGPHDNTAFQPAGDEETRRSHYPKMVDVEYQPRRVPTTLSDGRRGGGGASRGAAGGGGGSAGGGAHVNRLHDGQPRHVESHLPQSAWWEWSRARRLSRLRQQEQQMQMQRYNTVVLPKHIVRAREESLAFLVEEQHEAYLPVAARSSIHRQQQAGAASAPTRQYSNQHSNSHNKKGFPAAGGGGAARSVAGARASGGRGGGRGGGGSLNTHRKNEHKRTRNKMTGKISLEHINFLQQYWTHWLFRVFRLIGFILGSAALCMSIVCLVTVSWSQHKKESTDASRVTGGLWQLNFVSNNSKISWPDYAVGLSQTWRHAVVGLLICSALLLFIGWLFNVIAFYVHSLSRKIFFFHSASEFVFVAALASCIGNILYPVMINKFGMTLVHYEYVFYLSWVACGCEFLGSVLLSVDEIIREALRPRRMPRIIRRIHHNLTKSTGSSEYADKGTIAHLFQK